MKTPCQSFFPILAVVMVASAASLGAQDRTFRIAPARTTVEFTLGGRPFLAFDSPIRHEFDFTPSMSVFVRFTDEADVRSLFEQLAAGGDVLMPLDDYGFSACFGWTTDRFGVSWQVGQL